MPRSALGGVATRRRGFAEGSAGFAERSYALLPRGLWISRRSRYRLREAYALATIDP